MAALNNKINFKENIVLRVLGGLIFIFGFALFFLLSFSSTLRATNDPPLEPLESIKNILFGILVAGIVPLFVGGYFTLMFNLAKDFFIGTFLILPLFIVLHYVVAVFSVHPDDIRYISLQIFEFICAIVIIYRYQKNGHL